MVTLYQHIFDQCGLTNVWQSQENLYQSKWIAKSVEPKLKDQFIETWSAKIILSPKALCYQIFKIEFCVKKIFNDIIT